ncbi:hypothetical protein NFK58_23015 [Citrobacter portucalensis]|uniref:hypothetical protein n=1 Tax=Citrobacter TaxID=544 RepID=UPI000F453C83|nr:MULTISPECIES: hypothetical protein [Citrobacter]MBA8417813.1 hypothetical protein [Citrobacter freundii]RNL68646.1 hypothetical protein D7I40_16490 [Citrobacter sp. MH181794]MBJ9837954.1 hypothetical protein [Citrobacter freundii]MDE9616429.1 hypothetical protein [Citrobacter portucalensis]MDM2842284.1 hypothetical protein [Citrobacter sp. Cpo090]
MVLQKNSGIRYTSFSGVLNRRPYLNNLGHNTVAGAPGCTALFQMALQGTHIHPQGLELVRRLDI